MRHAVLVALLALVLAGAGCTGDNVATTTTTSVVATTSAGTTTFAPSTTSTSIPPTTTSSTSQPGGLTVVTVPFGSFFDIVSVPDSVSAPGLEVEVRRARLTGFDYHTENRINGQLDDFLAGRRATFVPNPDTSGVPARYSLDFEVLWPEEEAWPVLSIVYTETGRSAGAAEATTRRFALMFDLPTGEPLALGDMLTPEGVADLESMIRERLAETLDDLFCCFEPGELVANAGVARDGLRVYVDLGFPKQVGTLEFSFAWAEVAGLVDMRQRFLARRVVERGGCSVEGEGLVLEDQPGLPDAVAAKRQAIFEAAVACDFDALGALVPADWAALGWGSNAARGGTAEAWREAEADGDAALWFLARTLNLTYAEDRSSDGSGVEWHGFGWPAAAALHSGDWSTLPAAQRAELLALYDEERLASFDERDWFYGYRAYIVDDGTWSFFGVGIE